MPAVRVLRVVRHDLGGDRLSADIRPTTKYWYNVLYPADDLTPKWWGVHKGIHDVIQQHPEYADLSASHKLMVLRPRPGNYGAMGSYGEMGRTNAWWDGEAEEVCNAQEAIQLASTVQDFDYARKFESFDMLHTLLRTQVRLVARQ